MARRGIDPKRYSDPNLWQSTMQQVGLVWRLLKDARVPMPLKVIVPALVTLYVASPVDLLPDVILGLGQLDDVGLVMAALALFTRLAPRRVVEEHRAAMRGDAPVADASPDPDEPIMDAEYTVDARRRGATGR